jgi:hypothetical protein
VARPIRRLLFIVGSRRPEFYESLRRTFRGDDTVQVVADRRHGERRTAGRAGGHTAAREQRVAERREHLEIEWKLRSRGYAVVGVPATLPGAPAAARARPGAPFSP